MAVINDPAVVPGMTTVAAVSAGDSAVAGRPGGAITGQKAAVFE
jgi:hypothetical protein